MPARKSQVKKSYPLKNPRLSRRKSQKKSQKKSRKNKKSSRKASKKRAMGDRITQVMSMIRSRLSKREVKPTLEMESKITSFNNADDVPENCLKYDKAVIPCKKKDTEKQRKANWRKQSMLFHPDKVPKECAPFVENKITLLNNCCDSNDSYKPNKNCEL